MSRTSVACSRGITSRWPRVAGLMSMNAIVRSSSCTRVDGHLTGDDLAEQAVRVARPSPPQGTSLPARHAGDIARLRATVEHLASFDRPSASDGRAPGGGVDPRRAGGAGRGRAGRGGAGRRLDGDPAGAAVGRRRAGGAGRAAAGAARAAGGGGRSSTTSRGGPQVFRRLLPHRTTYNVVGEAGDPEAQETLVFVAHHDAAQGGLIYRPELTRLVADTFPGWYARQTTSPQMLRLVAAGPGARRARPAPAPARACVRLRRQRCWRSSTSPRAPSCRAPTTTSPRSRCCSSSRGCCASSRSRACACCSSPPARRSRSWRACAAGCAATGPRSTARAPASSCSRRSARRS